MYNLPSSQQEAKRLGVSLYNGTSCKHGHNAPRQTCNGTCTVCANDITKRSYNIHKTKIRAQAKQDRIENISHVLFLEIKGRAKKQQLAFDLAEEDIQVPSVCPILNIPLLVGNDHPKDNHPSVDRINPKQGYIKGNIVVISYRANRIKNDSTLEELEAIYNFYKGLKNE